MPPCSNMEQGPGTSVGSEFSSQDLSLLYSRALHVGSSRDEARVAMEKVSRGDRSWCCVGEDALDVLLDMEREREKKDKLYWDLQLLNVGNLNSLCWTDEQVSTDPHPESNPSKRPHSQSGSGRSQRGNFHPRQSGEKELQEDSRAMWRLRKAARQRWVRLASEGVQSIISPARGKFPESVRVRYEAWGCLSPSDVLLLVEVKYDAVTRRLYTEMLQEHHTLNVWERLLPGQKQREEEELEAQAEEALESGDVLGLAELPGAFRIYRAVLGPSCGNLSECWSAVSLLWDLHACRQAEKHSLTALSDRLDSDDLKLMSLYLRLATLRAERERTSYSALLAARQSWDGWPGVKNPCTAEQAVLWLREEEDEQPEVFISASPQQAALQLLVLIHEQERKLLTRLLLSVCVDDVQEPGCTESQEEERPEQAAVRACFVKRLKQIHRDTQTCAEQMREPPEAHAEAGGRRNSHITTQQQLEERFLLLLNEVMELQEIRASALLPELMEKSEQQVQALRDKFESGLQARLANLLVLLSEAPQSSAPHQNLTPEPIPAEPCGAGPAGGQNNGAAQAETPVMDSTKRSSREVNDVRDVEEHDNQDVCSGCGAVMEDLPYLEILCAPDATSDPHQILAAEAEAQEEEREGSETKSPRSFQKQGSLITLAWSKPPEDDSDYEADAEDGGTGQSEDAGSSLRTGVEQDDVKQMESEETPGRRGRAEQKADLHSQLRLEGEALPDQPGMGEAGAYCEAHLLVEPSVSEQLSGDACCDVNHETVMGETAEAEMCSETEPGAWDAGGREALNAEDPTDESEDTEAGSEGELRKTRKTTLMEREPISAMERERTMRSLVDMQRKVEQRQQRDRERQLLRVQERLCIVQNRKAEEDLLGLKHTERLKNLTQDLPQEDKKQQKTVVRERLEQLRRERSYVMQSKRERNTTGFKELLGPVALHSREEEDGED